MILLNLAFKSDSVKCYFKMVKSFFYYFFYFFLLSLKNEWMLLKHQAWSCCLWQSPCTAGRTNMAGDAPTQPPHEREHNQARGG